MEVGNGTCSLEGDLRPLRGGWKGDVGRKLLLKFSVTTCCAQHVIEYCGKTNRTVGEER